VLADVRTTRRAERAAHRWPAQTAARGGRFAGPPDGGGHTASFRRGRERSLWKRRDGTARGRPGQLADAGGPAVGRGRVR